MTESLILTDRVDEKPMMDKEHETMLSIGATTTARIAAVVVAMSNWMSREEQPDDWRGVVNGRYIRECVLPSTVFGSRRATFERSGSYFLVPFRLNLALYQISSSFSTINITKHQRRKGRPESIENHRQS